MLRHNNVFWRPCSIHQQTKRHVSFLTDSKNAGLGTAVTVPEHLVDITDITNRSNITYSTYDVHVNLKPNKKIKNLQSNGQHSVY